MIRCLYARFAGSVPAFFHFLSLDVVATAVLFQLPSLGMIAIPVFFQLPFPGVIENAVFFQFPFPGVIENAVSTSLSSACAKSCVFPVSQFPSSSLPNSVRGFPVFFKGKCVATLFLL